MKKIISVVFINKNQLKQTLLIMRLIIYLLLIAMLPTYASGYSQNTLLKFTEKPETLANVIETIENQTDYRIFYNTDQITLETPVNISKSEATVAEVLKTSLEGSDISYKLLGQMIVLAPTEYINEVRKVTGTVSDESGSTMPGVSVQVEGTSIATTTDVNGKFTIELPIENGVLIFTFIGYTPQKIAVKGGTTVNVTMKLESTSIEGVIVTGYGSQKKSNVTAAISSVKGEELTKLPMQRIDQALQGKAAGVMVLTTAGAPGAETLIRVRGMNSINGGNGAMVVIDGLQGGDLASLNPNDVESVEVLKDAAATAIYGAKGANGVLLITTKGGKKGKPMIDYSYSYGSQTVRKKIDLMGAYDYAVTRNEYAGLQNANGNVPTMPISEAELAGFKANGGTDWQNEVYRTAPIQNHQLTMSGGADNINYLVSAGYLNQDGILINTNFQRYSMRANFNAKINKVVSFGLNWAGSKDNSNVTNYGGSAANQMGWNQVATNLVLRWSPTVGVYNPDGTYAKSPSTYGTVTSSPNPVASALEPIIENGTIHNNLGANLDFKIVEGLTLKIMGGAVTGSTDNQSYYNGKTRKGKPSNGKVGAAYYDYNTTTHYQNTNILTYDHILAEKNHFTLTGVVEQQADNYKGFSEHASQFLVDQTGANDLGGATQIDSKSTYKEKRTLNSYLGRVFYSYDEKYLFTFSYRADGSSVFGANNKWGYFPATSLAWRMGEESFIKDLDIFSNLKVRGSWGITGNQGINPYETMAKMRSGANYPFYGGSNTNIGFEIANAANPDLKWESTTQTDIGLDLGMFKGRLTATIDLYKKTTDDLLLNKTVPAYTGATSVLSNVGSIENKGLEFSVGGDPFVGDFKWNVNFNISFNRNKILDMGEYDRLTYVTTSGGYGINGGILELRKGEPFGQMYGYGYEGVWQSSQAAEAAKYGQLPGTMHYTDVNNDGKIDPTNDIMVIGNAQPKYIYGFNNRFTYKNFELNVFVQGSHGNDLFNVPRIYTEADWVGTSSRILDKWVANTHENTDVPGFIDQATWQAHPELVNTISFGQDNENANQRWVEDASYLRFKNIVLAYNLPAELIRKAGLTKLRVYASATNLITITNYTGYDPEVSSYSNNDAEIGIDFNNYPTAKVISFGIDVSF